VDELREILRNYWGYDSFRPLQTEAMRAVVEGRDSVVVLPTGGGKSLCFQAPAMLRPGLAVVISPLISLMKDQVDALTDNGVPAACINSTVTYDEKRRVADEIRAGRLKLLYLSPERLMTDKMMDYLHGVSLSFFAIDEAHCISEWGHDFRPEYRMLRQLKEKFPTVAVHAYTATATAQVRADIVRELGLKNPENLVGSFDRPNLVYRVQRRTDIVDQAREIIDRYSNDSGLIYCIRRADVDELSAALNGLGYQTLPYHAGMSDDERRKNQEAFLNDRVKTVVATVAFGMGIDKSNVRYVIHAGAPKSLESYQQESGRAGRDGLEAECWLFYSAGDFRTWRILQQELPEHAFEIAMKVLSGIEGYCIGAGCRHRAITKYFGQELESENCGACDVCLDEMAFVDDALIISQKILSSVVRQGENFGGEYTTQVLTGSREKRILDNGHDKLSTYGLLAEHDKKAVRAWVEQLVGQGYLQKQGEYNVLQITPAGRRVLKGDETPRLLQPAARRRKKSLAENVSWEGVDRGLFDALRDFRRRKADDRGIAPFIVFGDATLRDLARYRPSTLEHMRDIHGIGEKKLAEYGAELLVELDDFCRRSGLARDVSRSKSLQKKTSVPNGSESEKKISQIKREAFRLFAAGKTVDEVSEAIGRAKSTTMDYLAEHIEREKITDCSPWLDPAVFERIRAVALTVDTDRLKPIFETLNGTVDYNQIRIALACMRNLA
jgi:ATP-dependent DNA helicase RecQ